ncbi:MAG: heme-dependent oxidative N-demethylase subunit alpha family protein [Burkholderiaceae bacterium]
MKPKTLDITQGLAQRWLSHDDLAFPGPPESLDPAVTRVGAIDCPFPVDIPHEIRPDLIKLAPTEPLLIVDKPQSRWMDCLSQKIQRLRSTKAFVYADDLNPDDLQFWAQQVIYALSTLLPHGPVHANGALAWIGSEPPNDPIDFFLGLSLSLQEDFVLMAPRHRSPPFPSDENPLRARLLSVCFPSGWIPEEKCDQSLFSIHMPVADNSRIQKAAASLSAAMAQKGPFVRFVHTLAPNSTMWRDPGQPPWVDFGGLEHVWFRVERQVTIPLAGTGSLFLIRLFVVPLLEVLSRPGRSKTLAEALDTMSPALRVYKGLHHIAPGLIHALKDHANREARSA